MQRFRNALSTVGVNIHVKNNSGCQNCSAVCLHAATCSVSTCVSDALSSLFFFLSQSADSLIGAIDSARTTTTYAEGFPSVRGSGGVGVSTNGGGGGWGGVASPRYYRAARLVPSSLDATATDNCEGVACELGASNSSLHGGRRRLE